MFGFFASQEKKMRENAGNWLELADKVYHYRRDVLTVSQVGELQSAIANLRGLVKERAGAEKLKLAIERLEEVLRRTGGAIYPKTALVENVEFFLVAAIVILGIRTYFVQPFKIPTNSMWPTYNGMTPEVWKNAEDSPGIVMKAVRFVLFGAQHKEMIAPESGTVTVPVASDGRIPYQLKPARTWLVFPTTNKEYTFQVNSTPMRLRVPEDFDFEWAFTQATGLKPEDRARMAATSNLRSRDSHYSGITLSKPAEKGKPVISFDIITGDQLFVDRMSYHFVRPKVGQGFVFRTDHIVSEHMRDGRTGGQLEQYYIKRLVGGPGDVLEIREPALYRNGAPITGSSAFAANAKLEGDYKGYVAIGQLAPGETVKIPPDRYYAMGDNSGNSADSRYWGFVPAKDVVGRPLLVYYPFTKHWGPAK